MASKILRAPSGIIKLDSALEGGFPQNSAVLLQGTPGVGKSILCQQFIYSGLKKDEKCIFITLDVRPETIMESMQRFGWISKNSIIFFDCFSYRISQQSISRYAISGLSDLNQMSMIFEDILKDVGDAPKRIVLDSISTLLLYSDPEFAPKFMKSFISTAIAQKSVMLITVEEGLHDAQTTAMLNYLSDGLIEMKFEMDKRLMRVSKMRNTMTSRAWIEYEITKKGINVV